MKTTSLIFLLSFFFLACSKEVVDTRPDCEVNRKAFLVVSNASAYTYDIYVSSIFKFTVQPGTVTTAKEVPISLDKTLIQAKQTSFSPTNPTRKDVEYINYLTACQSYSIQIP